MSQPQSPDPAREPDPRLAPAPGDLSALEARLRGWTPAAPATDAARDRLLFEAGRAAARPTGPARPDRRLAAYRLAASVLALTTLSLGGLLARQRTAEARLRAERSALVARLAEFENALRPIHSDPGLGVGTQLARLEPGEPPGPFSYLNLSRHPEALASPPPRPSDAAPPSGRMTSPTLTPLQTRSAADALDL